MVSEKRDSLTDDDSLDVGRPGNGRKRLALLVCLFLVAGAGGWYLLQDNEEVPTTQPLIVTVSIGDIENTIAATGSLKPSEIVEVGAQVSGQLQQIYVEAGDVVQAGELLAEIDASRQQSQVAASIASLEGQRAQLESRRSALRLAESNAQRQQRLMESNATSEQDFDNAMNQLESARSSLIQLEKQIEQSEASLAIDERELEFTQVRAPITGTVVSVAMTEGRTLNASQSAPTILTIADLSVMEVEAQISEADISRLKSGMEVYFTTLGGGSRRWQSQLEQILPQPVIDNNVVLYTGLFEIDNSDGALLPEMTAQIYFVTSAARDVLTVPLGALTFIDADGGPASAGSGFAGAMARSAGASQNFQPGTGFMPVGDSEGFAPGVLQASAAGGGDRQGNRLAMVQTVAEDGSIREREVMIGLTSRISAEVVSGLQVGDQVVAGVVDAGAEGVDFRTMMRSVRGF